MVITEGVSPDVLGSPSLPHPSDLSVEVCILTSLEVDHFYCESGLGEKRKKATEEVVMFPVSSGV